MKFKYFTNKSGQLGKKAEVKQVQLGVEDVYQLHLLERLNYCKTHPTSNKCQ